MKAARWAAPPHPAPEATMAPNVRAALPPLPPHGPDERGAPWRPVRLSELVGALSHALDLTEGQPRGHAARTCRIGMRIAGELGLGPGDSSDLYYALLLKDAGCSSNAAATVDFFGSDDHDVKRRFKMVDWTRRLDAAAYAVANAAVGRSFGDRMRQILNMRTHRGAAGTLIRIRCERGSGIVRDMGFPQATADAVRTLDEHWDGSGEPEGLSGEEIPLLARIASLAQTMEVFAAERGWRQAVRVALDRQGTWFDPGLVKVAATLDDPHWWASLYHGDPVARVPGFEPDERLLTVDPAGVDRVAEAFAEVVDAKSPFTYRHSARVAELARRMVDTLGASPEVGRAVYRAGLLHDLGKLGISNRILDKPGALTPRERTVVEHHPLMTWDIVSQVEAFRPIARLASVHHERLDGAGYPWGIAASGLDRLDRILAVCDVYEALTADRPYRAGLEPRRAFEILRSLERKALDPEMVRVLEATEEDSAVAA